MYYLGMDVHARMTVICVLDAKGKRLFCKTVDGTAPSVVTAVRDLKQTLGGRLVIGYEASCGYGWLYEHLRPIAERVVVAHPGQLRLIYRAKRKNDRIDATKLAYLLYANLLPAVHVPGADGRAWRRMVEHRNRLVAKRTAAKNAIKGLLRMHAIEMPKNLWSKAGLKWVGEVELDEFAAVERDQLLEQLAQFERQLKQVETALDSRADREPAVALLRQIPGVGQRTAEAVAAYIDDPGRFHSNKAIGCYFGLVPCEDTSVKRRLGHITQEGPATVRRLLTQAAWQAVRRDEQWKAVFERIGRDDPDRRKIAIVAIAHRLLRVMLAMLKTGECYRAAA